MEHTAALRSTHTHTQAHTQQHFITHTNTKTMRKMANHYNVQTISTEKAEVKFTFQQCQFIIVRLFVFYTKKVEKQKKNYKIFHTFIYLFFLIKYKSKYITLTHTYLNIQTLFFFFLLLQLLQCSTLILTHPYRISLSLLQYYCSITNTTTTKNKLQQFYSVLFNIITTKTPTTKKLICIAFFYFRLTRTTRKLSLFLLYSQLYLCVYVCLCVFVYTVPVQCYIHFYRLFVLYTHTWIHYNINTHLHTQTYT